jgi:hypothetical protein
LKKAESWNEEGKALAARRRKNFAKKGQMQWVSIFASLFRLFSAKVFFATLSDLTSSPRRTSGDVPSKDLER